MWLARGRQQGSPPQVRGKLSHTSPALISSRITPAGAGKTPQVTLVPMEHKDHPRRCGENPTRWRPTNLQRGSPPQVRGKRAAEFRHGGEAGITPAGAGKTIGQKYFCPCKKDHPRRCGENAMVTPRSEHEKGSPPQVRGKQATTLALRAAKRITPAGAGKTGHAINKCRYGQDHPRRCGENCPFCVSGR